jgi:hypothetical protein
MKIDRFMKAVLVIIVGLLILNYLKDGNSSLKHIPSFEAEVSADGAPSFIQVGKTYNFGMNTPNGFVQTQARVSAIDNNGWVQQASGEWMNLSYVLTVKEIK